MSNEVVKEMTERILKIERASIKRRKNTVNANTSRFGINKADSDVVRDILKILEEGGIGNENTSN